MASSVDASSFLFVDSLFSPVGGGFWVWAKFTVGGIPPLGWAVFVSLEPVFFFCCFLSRLLCFVTFAYPAFACTTDPLSPLALAVSLVAVATTVDFLFPSASAVPPSAARATTIELLSP